jgi:hypothetical protein
MNSFNCVYIVSILLGNILKTRVILKDSHDLVGWKPWYYTLEQVALEVEKVGLDKGGDSSIDHWSPTAKFSINY